MAAQFQQPIFIIGEPHSGTTILYRMLAGHPDVAWFSQYSQRDGSIPSRRRVPGYAIMNRWLRGILGVNWQKQKGMMRYVRPTPSEAHKVFDQLLPRRDEPYTADNYSEEMAQRWREVFARECRDWQRDRLIVKLPRLTRAIGLIHAIFPDALFVHIIRDGKAVALSNEHKFGEQGGKEPLAASARSWSTSVMHVREQPAEIREQTKTLFYEDLCHDIHGYLYDICHFCELDLPHVLMQRLPTQLPITNEQWFGQATPQQKRIINDEVGDELPYVGYQPFDLGDHEQ